MSAQPEFSAELASAMAALGQLISKEEGRKRVLADPHTALRDAGIDLPEPFRSSLEKLDHGELVAVSESCERMAKFGFAIKTERGTTCFF